MANYETKNSVDNFIEYTDNQVYYNDVKDKLITSIINNIKTIILVGSGGNGKTYLTNELNNYIYINNYSIYQDGMIFLEEGVSNFNTILNSIEGNKIIHLQFNPFVKWNISVPQDCEIISMEHIKFQ